MIIPFLSGAVTLENSGGKGANLARLARAGFNVPPGFIVSTDAYRAFVAANNLETVIASALENLSADDPAQLETASAKIRGAFAAGKMPGETRQAIAAAYTDLHPKSQIQNPKSVAVRSSATAEDLPDLSFAGQQDTYLNIIGAEQVLKAVIDCWGSLWTARAIGYRMRNNIPRHEIALAVIVQEMVPSEVSGVLFTANPLTGLRSESVIDATFGLGEALVSGQVEPDHFVVQILTTQNTESTEKNQKEKLRELSVSVVEKTLGEKQVSTRSKTGGGVETVTENAGERQTLTDEQIRQLVETGQKIQNEYGAPQDIEWAFADNTLYILQSRAITSLFPLPYLSLDPLVIWFSFGAVQGLVGPMTPLGQDGIRHVAANASRMFGQKPDIQNFTYFASAGERIWVKISDVMRHPIGRRIFEGALGFIEPSVGQIIAPLADDPRVGLGQGKFKFSTARRMAHFALPVLARFIRNMLRPEAARARFDADIEAYFASAQIAPAADRFGRLANVIAFMRERMAGVFAYLLPRFIPAFGPSMGAWNFLDKISPELALEVTRGLPNNVTTQMDLALWETAREIKADSASAALFRDLSAPELAARFMSGTLPSAAQLALGRFLTRYGVRGVGEIDFGQKRWREDPTPLMHTLQSYLQIDPASAPDVLFARGEQAAQDAIEKLAALARNQHGGWIKEKLVRAFAKRIRLLMGARESPKFFAIRTIGIARAALLEVGQEFVAAGTINQPDDLVFLHLDELDDLARGGGSRSAPAKDWKSLVAERRAVYERELRRRQVPRVLVSDGRTFYEGLGAATDTGDAISGSPVSAGVAEGIVHVVLDPRGVHLSPGEILVCPGTDPAWTPLFMAAGGLVTEVGGMMTHGSVVAREYGIPAVVGVHQATIKLKNGQKIRVDGTRGTISVLE
jgi:pyruvate,water dikinase